MAALGRVAVRAPTGRAGAAVAQGDAQAEGPVAPAAARAAARGAAVVVVVVVQSAARAAAGSPAMTIKVEDHSR